MDPTEKTVSALLERLQAGRPKVVKVETKTLGAVYVRRQTGEDQLKLSALRQEIGAGTLISLPKAGFAAVFGAVQLLNEDGTPLFASAAAGYNILKEANVKDLEEIYEALIGVQLGPEALEDAEKKSSSSQTSEPGTN